MKSRLLSMGLAVVSAALVACGGGGGGGGNPPPTLPPSAPPTATPSPKPTNNPYGCVGQTPFTNSAARRSMAAPRPIAAGDQFTYSGSLQQTYSASAPCPQPTATTSATITMKVTDAATTAPNGGGSATDSTSVETDAFPTQSTTTTTSDVLQIAGSKLLLYSTSSNDGTGNSIQTSYGSAQEIDDLGSSSPPWTFNPAATISESLSDGTAIARTLASDGSYTDTETYADGSTATIAVNGAANGKPLDGSGVYSFVGDTFSYAAPAAGTITLTITSPGAANKTRTFPAWFTVPSSGGYVTDSFTDAGSAPFDASCSVSPTIGTSGDRVVETYSVLDPVLGYTETRTTTSYDVAGYGPACVTIADTLKSYYDYSGDTTRIDYQSTNGQPNSLSTIAETLSMQSATCTGGPPCAQVRRTQTEQPVSPVAVAARIAAIDHYRALQRARRAEALRAFALHFVHQGAVR